MFTVEKKKPIKIEWLFLTTKNTVFFHKFQMYKQKNVNAEKMALKSLQRNEKVKQTHLLSRTKIDINGCKFSQTVW